MTKKVRRLFEQFQPTNYQLSLAPDADAMTFKGSVTITGQKVGRPSERITLHQKELKILSATLTKKSKTGDEQIEIVRINTQKKYDELRLHANDTLYSGTYTINIEFEGIITDPMHGLYPCYFEHEGKNKKLLATQFESHHAREVFPCIDEPEAKATFDLTLITLEGLTVLGNTPAKTQRSANNLTTTEFETSPVMSTYLLAFVIGEMHCAEAKSSDGTIIRTWSTVAQPKEFLSYATEEGVKILEFFTDYFKTPFPLSKCDQVALPDFESGAMENWGLITYREIALLADPNNRSQSSEQYVSMVVAHELSHQWFGNLVTMKWWDDLWLNESFASLMEHVALDSLHPDWSQWEQYTASDVISCSSRDLFKDVQSVHVEVNHPEEISTLFDPAIVYAKGGRLLKMLREYIGDEAFRNGLQSYFKKYAYKNTVGNDLWLEMSESSGKDIALFMDPWIKQSGMPVITVDQSSSSIDISQNRFVLDTDNDKSLWPVPLLSDQPLEIDILSRQSASLEKLSDDPVIFNQYGSGHMLINYTDAKTKDFIAQSFSSQSLLPESRINILNDTILLARGGVASLVDGLNLVKSSATETRDSVWLIMARVIGTASVLTEGNNSTEQSIRNFKSQIAADWYQKLGWEDKKDESPNEIALRQTILSLTIGGEYQPAINEALDRFNNAPNIEALAAEQRGLIAGVAVRFGENKVIDKLLAEYQDTQNPDVQLAISSALCSTRDPKAARHILDEALGDNGFVRPQDIFRWFAYLSRNRHTRSLAWDWLTTNWDRLEKLFGDSKSFDYFVIYAAAPISTVAEQKKFNEFFNQKSNIISLKRNIEIAKSEIESRVNWRQREELAIEEFFSQ